MAEMLLGTGSGTTLGGHTEAELLGIPVRQAELVARVNTSS